MSNGLGAGFAALTLLAVLAGLAALSAFVTGYAALASRRTGRIRPPVRYAAGAIGAGALGEDGEAGHALFDEAPVAAGLFAVVCVFPILACGGYLGLTTDLVRLEVVATTVLAWGAPFLLGLAVTFGLNGWLVSGSELTGGESRRLGVPWIAAAAGGFTITLGAVLLATRLRELIVAEQRSTA